MDVKCRKCGFEEDINPDSLGAIVAKAKLFDFHLKEIWECKDCNPECKYVRCMPEQNISPDLIDKLEYNCGNDLYINFNLPETNKWDGGFGKRVYQEWIQYDKDGKMLCREYISHRDRNPYHYRQFF